MATSNLPEEYMKPLEMAQRMCKSVEWVTNELREDSKRDFPRYPFAIATYNEKTRTWSYRINRAGFEKWQSGDYTGFIDLDRLADIIVDKMMGQMGKNQENEME